jgi:hypothetical protein
MAVNLQKLLPSSSTIVKVGKIKTNKRTENNSTDSLGEIKKELEKIKENLKKIHNLVLFNNKLIEKDLKLKRLTAERLKFAKKEKRLEEKNPEKKDKKDDKSIPKLGFFDRINRFIMFTLLGWVGVRLVKYLPKLIEFTKNIGPVMEFFSSFTANIFTGIVDFIDWGYKAHDNFREFIGELGGEPFQKAFDDFSSNLNKFVNLAIIAGIAASGGTDFGLGKKPGKPGTQPKPKPGQGGRPKVTTSGGGGAGRPDLRNPLRQRPNVTTSGGGGAGRLDIRNPLRQKPKITGGGGFKLPKINIPKGIGGLFGRFLLILDIIETSKKVFNPDDNILLELGNLGLSVYNAFQSNPNKKQKYFGKGLLAEKTNLKIDRQRSEQQKLSAGGQIGKRRGRGASATRGGKQVGGAIRRQVRRVLEPPKATPISPGRSVGGKEKIQEMFPEAEDDNTMNPYGHLTETSKMMTDTNWLGPVFNLFAKTQAGDLPSQSDYKRVGTSINGWVNAAIAAGGGSSSGYSNGGVVNNGGIGDISKWLEKSAEELFQSKAQQAIRDLRKNLTLEPLTGDYDYDEGGVGPANGREGGSSDGVIISDDAQGLAELGITQSEWNAYKQGIADIEVRGQPNGGYGIMGGSGGRFAGRYQMGDEAITEAAKVLGITKPSRQEFLGNPQLQERMYLGYTISNFRYMQRLSPEFRNMTTGQKLATLPMAQLGIGNLSNQLRTGTIARDANGTPTTKFSSSVEKRLKEAGLKPLGQNTGRGGSSGSPSSGRIAEERGTGGDGKSRSRQGSTAGGGGSSGGVIYKGMKTGPSEYIGGSAAYHIDTKFHRSLGMGTMVSAMDKLANAYSARGREMVFSNSGVRLQVWNPSAPSRDKSTLLQRAIDAHSHSPFMRSEGFLPFDYYIPFKSANRDLYHKSTEGAEILLPTFGGNVSVGTKYGGYGRSAEIFNGSGKMVAMTGHGDTRYGEGDSGESVDSGESGEGGKGSKSSGGMWGFSGFGGWGFSGFGGWGFSGFGGSSKKSRKGKGSDSEDSDLSGLSGKDKKIYLHWNAAPYTNPIGPYHTVFLGDGKKVQHADYNTHRNHTDGRNTNAIGLAIAAMHEGSPTNWKNAPTSAQINAMVSEAANIAKSMGWNASDINKSNIMTHAEAAFLDGYGLGSGDSQTRWDLITLRGSDATSGNLKKPGSKGGNELRGMIRQKMKYGGPVGGKENTRNSLNYKPPYESHQQTQVVLVPIETVVQVPGSDNKAISFGGVNSIIDPTKYSFSYTG